MLSRLQPAGLVLLLLMSIPIVGIILYVARYGYTVPWHDEYVRMVPLLQLARSGGLTPADLFVQFAEHRIPVPYTLSIILAALHGGDLRLELATNILFALASLAFVIDLYRRQAIAQAPTFIFSAASAWLLFSLGQRENWVWGNQKCMFIMMACVYACAWAMARFPTGERAFWVCLVSTLIASWSFLSANVLWVILPVVLWLRGYRSWTHYARWIIVALASLTVYVAGYEGFNRDPNYSPFDIDTLTYFAGYLGGPFTPETLHLLEDYIGAMRSGTIHIAVVMGIAGIAALVLNLAFARFARRVSVSDLSPWLLLVGFSMANGLLLTFGRVGDHHAVIARYITIVLPFWIAILALSLDNLRFVMQANSRRAWGMRLTLYANAAAALLLIAGYTANTLRAYEARETLNWTMAECFGTLLEADERCRRSHFFFNGMVSEERVIEMLSFFKEEGMFLFRDSGKPNPQVIDR